MIKLGALSRTTRGIVEALKSPRDTRRERDKLRCKRKIRRGRTALESNVGSHIHRRSHTSKGERTENGKTRYKQKIAKNESEQRVEEKLVYWPTRARPRCSLRLRGVSSLWFCSNGFEPRAGRNGRRRATLNPHLLPHKLERL